MLVNSAEKKLDVRVSGEVLQLGTVEGRTILGEQGKDELIFLLAYCDEISGWHHHGWFSWNSFTGGLDETGE